MISSLAVRPVDRVRVMVVDDSVVARSLTSRWLQDQPDFHVVACCRSGREAVDQVAWAKPGVVVLDVEMPDLDGVAALPLLLRADPRPAVLMASSFTTQGATLSVRCLALGAADVLAKPSRNTAHADDYRLELVAKVRALGQAGARSVATPSVAKPLSAAAVRGLAPAPVAITAPASRARVRAIAIGASTGGPQALGTVLKAIGPSISNAIVLVTQHMPVGFTGPLAEHLSVACGIPVKEAEDGETLRDGTVYVAPGGRHFSVERTRGQFVARLADGPPVNFCKPSVDPLFRSASTTFGSGLVAVMLTGMGADGASATPAVAAAGGRVIAQDEATSVVWGMPGATVAAGACGAVLAIEDIGPRIVGMIRGTRA